MKKVTLSYYFNGNPHKTETLVETKYAKTDFDFVCDAIHEINPGDGFYNVTVCDMTSGKTTHMTIKAWYDWEYNWQVVGVDPNTFEVTFHSHEGQKWFVVESVNSCGIATSSTFTEWDGHPVANLSLPKPEVVWAYCKVAQNLFTDEIKIMSWLIDSLLNLGQVVGVRKDIF